MQTRLMLKATIITFLMPGSAIVLLPYIILSKSDLSHWPDLSIRTVVAAIFALVGLAVLLQSIWGFAVHGKGTLAPIDPPKQLVIRGLYKYTRNPMYLAIVCVLLSEALLFNNLSIVVYATVAFLGFHLFVTLYEEPHLRSRFGASYEEYCRIVPRWGITTRSLAPTDRTNEPTNP